MILCSDSLGISTAIFLSFSLICCSGKNPSSQEQTSGNDSSKTLTYEERQGKQLYNKYCAVCHGQEGKGDGFNAFNLDPRPKDFSDSRYMNALGGKQILQTISGGGRSVNKSALMPPYEWTLKKEEIQYIESYLRTFYSGE
jgi:mono/diheme cytochrome c family protein